MSFTLTIGEFDTEIDPEERYASATAKEKEHPDAPLNSNWPSGDRTNTISPAYGTWHDFCVTTGLYSVFFAPRCSDGQCGKSCWWIDSEGEEQDGLMREHPGVGKLEKIHLIEFQTARERYLARPEPRPGVADDGVDWALRRLDWLCWWTEWALENCEYPTFANS